MAEIFTVGAKIIPDMTEVKRAFQSMGFGGGLKQVGLEGSGASGEGTREQKKQTSLLTSIFKGVLGANIVFSAMEPLLKPILLILKILMLTFFIPLLPFFKDGMQALIDTFGPAKQFTKDFITPALEFLGGQKTPGGASGTSTLAGGAAIGGAIGLIGGPVGVFVGALLGALIGAIIPAIVTAGMNFGMWLGDAIDKFVAFFINLNTEISLFVSGFISDFGEAIGPFIAGVGEVISDIGTFLWDEITKAIGDLSKVIGEGLGFAAWLWDKLITAIGDFGEDMFEGAASFAEWLWNKILTAFGTAWDTLATLGTWLFDTAKQVFSDVFDSLRAGINAFFDILRGVGFGDFKPFADLPELQKGGTIMETGVAVVHKGETVTPAGGGGVVFAPVYHISADVNSQALKAIIKAENDMFLGRLRSRGTSGGRFLNA